MNMKKHVTSVCKSTNFHLRNISAIRIVLSDSSATQLVHAMITSRLDYCNALLFGIPDCQVQRLLWNQIMLPMFFAKITKYDHITPSLKRLHWQPVKERILFKTILHTYKALNGKAPAYITALLTPYSPPHSLRSGEQHLIIMTHHYFNNEEFTLVFY